MPVVAYPPDTLVIRNWNGQVGVIAKECICSLSYTWGVHYEILWDDEDSLSTVAHKEIKAVFYTAVGSDKQTIAGIVRMPVTIRAQ
jgi:hypothetical protein